MAKKTVLHCGSGNRAGAAVALACGLVTRTQNGYRNGARASHGLTKLEEEVHNRLLVPPLD